MARRLVPVIWCSASFPEPGKRLAAAVPCQAVRILFPAHPHACHSLRSFLAGCWPDIRPLPRGSHRRVAPRVTSLSKRASERGKENSQSFCSLISEVTSVTSAIFHLLKASHWVQSTLQRWGHRGHRRGCLQ